MDKPRPLNEAELNYIIDQQSKEISRLLTQGYLYQMQIQSLIAENEEIIKENEAMKQVAKK